MVSGSNDLSVAELVGEANHEAAKSLIAVEATIVGADTLEVWSSGESRNPRVRHERKRQVSGEEEEFVCKPSGSAQHASPLLYTT